MTSSNDPILGLYRFYYDSSNPKKSCFDPPHVPYLDDRKVNQRASDRPWVILGSDSLIRSDEGLTQGLRELSIRSDQSLIRLASD